MTEANKPTSAILLAAHHILQRPLMRAVGAMEPGNPYLQASTAGVHYSGANSFGRPTPLIAGGGTVCLLRISPMRHSASYSTPQILTGVMLGNTAFGVAHLGLGHHCSRQEQALTVEGWGSTSTAPNTHPSGGLQICPQSCLDLFLKPQISESHAANLLPHASYYKNPPETASGGCHVGLY
jgi:hypothetical protein